MRKVLIPIAFIFCSVIVSAQKYISAPFLNTTPILNTEPDNFTKGLAQNDKGILNPVVIGDTILFDDFSNSANWTAQNLGSGTKNWVIGVAADADAAQLATYTMSLASWNPDASAGNKFAYYDAVYYLVNQSVPTFLSVTLEYNGTLDLSAYPGIGIQWNQNHKAYNQDKIYFEYSIDGGTTWNAAGGDEIYPNMEVNFYAPVYKYFNLSNQIGNNNSVKIRFRWECNYSGTNPNAYGAGYGWMIDNVLVLGLSNNDLLVEKIYPRFYGLGYYAKIPDRQKMKLSSVKALVLNNGSTGQSDIFSDADVRILGNPVADFSASASVPYAVLDIGTRDTLETDTFTYVTPAGINTHLINFTATQTETEDHPADNHDTITFAVTDTVYARDRNYSGRFGPTRVAGSNDGDYSAVGFYLTKQDTAESVSVFIATGTKVNAQIAGIISYYQSGNTLTEQIFTNNYTILSTDINKWVTLSFRDVFDGFSEVLDSNKLYYVGVKYYWKTITPLTQGIYVGTDKEAPCTDDDWSGGVNYFVKADGTVVGHLTEMPKIRLNVSYPHYLTMTPAIVIEKNFSNIYPNPSSGSVYFNNKNISDIYVYNMIGICIQHYESVSDKIDLSSLPDGTYFIKYSDNGNVVIKKLNIIK